MVTKTQPIRRSALTLTELLVVVGIVVLALGLSVPAISVWESRKEQEGVNMINRLLKEARVKAMTEGTTIGLFFYVEPISREQRVWPIEPQIDSSTSAAINQTAERFVLREGNPFIMPKPWRVMPQSVLDARLPVHRRWLPDQLENEDVRDASIPLDSLDGTDAGTQYHRSFFVMLFNKDGQLLSNRRVFVADLNTPGHPTNGNSSPDPYPGAHTGLWVSHANAGMEPVSGLHNIVVDDQNQPLRFYAARDLLVYNDDGFRALARSNTPSYDDDHVDYARRLAQPVYVHNFSGKVIKGRTDNLDEQPSFQTE